MAKGDHGFDKPFGGYGKPPKTADEQSEMRKHFIAATGEFVGTFLFLLFAFLAHSMAASQAATFGPQQTASSETVVFISLAYGLSLLVTAWTLYRVSGGLFNPAVTIGLILCGAVPPVRGLILIPVQFIGAICAAAVAAGLIPGDIIVVQTTLAPGVGVAQGLFLEMFLTSQLIFTILMLAAEKQKATFIAPIGIGLALFVVELAGVFWTGASVNPARSFAPCVVGAQFPSYHWIYWLGPVFGALLASAYYHLVKYLNYEDANPGQDSAEGAFDPVVERTESGTLKDDGTMSNSPNQNRQSGYSRDSYEMQNSPQQRGQQRNYSGADGNRPYSQEDGRPSYSQHGGQAPRVGDNIVQGMTGRI